MIIFLYGYLFYVFGKDIFQKLNPELIQTSDFVLDSSRLQFNNYQYPVAFGLMDYNEWIPYRDPTIYNVKYNIMKSYVTTLENGTHSLKVENSLYDAVNCTSQQHF